MQAAQCADLRQSPLAIAVLAGWQRPYPHVTLRERVGTGPGLPVEGSGGAALRRSELLPVLVYLAMRLMPTERRRPKSLLRALTAHGISPVTARKLQCLASTTSGLTVWLSRAAQHCRLKDGLAVSRGSRTFGISLAVQQLELVQ